MYLIDNMVDSMPTFSYHSVPSSWLKVSLGFFCEMNHKITMAMSSNQIFFCLVSLSLGPVLDCLS